MCGSQREKKTEGQKKSRGSKKNRRKMSVTEKRVDLRACVCMRICAHGHVRQSKIEIEGEKGKARLLHAGRDDAKSADCYKSVTAGPCRQSPLQETQIKADLSSQDLFRAVPTSSLDPVAILSFSVLRSVRRGDKAVEVSRGKIL